MAINGVIVILLVTVLSVNSRLGKREGAACTADGNSGTCKLWKKCFTLIADHASNVFPPVCSFKKAETIVCCTSCDIVDDISKAVLDPLGRVLWKTDQISWNQCLDYLQTAPYTCKEHNTKHFRKKWDAEVQCFDTYFENNTYSEASLALPTVSDGLNARRYEFPHMALLGYGPSKDFVDWFCGGTIISDRFILTAGHCTTDPNFGPVTYAALGILKRSDPKELWRIYEIIRIVVHPEYHRTSKYNDIALLETDRRINFDMSVLPACLPRLNVTAEDDEVEAIGWGAVNQNNVLSDTLQIVKLKKVNSTRCLELFGIRRQLTRGYDHTTQMCYISEAPGRNICVGNSGGPLHISGQASACQKTVIGVTSFGYQCRLGIKVGIYTRVRPYVPWIESVVWP